MNAVRRVLRLGPPRKSRVYRSIQGWKTIGGRKIYFRSNWEVKFAKYLQWLKEQNQIKEWEHEPETFWFEKIKRGVRSYMPDFKVTRLDDTHYWVEVKGYMDKKSHTKIKRFGLYYPKEQLVIVNEEWFKNNLKGVTIAAGACETKSL